MKHQILLFYLLSLPFGAYAQCEFDPKVEGDSILCPSQIGILSTQDYDVYQWYRRFLLDQDAEIIAGATGQSLEVNTLEDAGYYFSVEATIANCTERSPELLVDAWAFLPPVVAHAGEFMSNGTFFTICEGDTMFNALQLPYDTLIQWYRNNEAILDANEPVLAVTMNGMYTVEGAPSICPEFVQSLGLSINVIVDPACSTALDDPEMEAGIKLFPNPISNILYIENANDNPIEMLYIWDITGKLLWMQELNNGFNTQFDFRGLSSGLFLIGLQIKEGMIYKKISKI